MVGSAVQCTLLYALMSVYGPGSPLALLDEARFTCLYRTIHVTFPLIRIFLALQSNQLAFFSLTQLCRKNKKKKTR